MKVIILSCNGIPVEVTVCNDDFEAWRLADLIKCGQGVIYDRLDIIEATPAKVMANYISTELAVIAGKDGQ